MAEPSQVEDRSRRPRGVLRRLDVARRGDCLVSCWPLVLALAACLDLLLERRAAGEQL